MNNLYEVLETCLQDLEQGAEIETVLFRYPELADELRPILEASVNAKNMTVPAPSTEVVLRNRAKVLQQAAQMREEEAKVRTRRLWSVPLRRALVTLIVLVMLFASGTGLVRAASNTLPGDQLYPVKRTWEDVLIAFTFNMQQRDALEVEHENERIQELQELFAEGRSAKVDFTGSITSQNLDQWLISGIPVAISPQTEMSDQHVLVGSAVRVTGQAQGNGVVLAERIVLLPPGSTLPDVNDEQENESEDQAVPTLQIQDDSGGSGRDETPTAEVTQKSEEALNDGLSSVTDDSSSSDGNQKNDGKDDKKQGDDKSSDGGHD